MALKRKGLLPEGYDEEFDINQAMYNLAWQSSQGETQPGRGGRVNLMEYWTPEDRMFAKMMHWKHGMSTFKGRPVSGPNIPSRGK